MLEVRKFIMLLLLKGDAFPKYFVLKVGTHLGEVDHLINDILDMRWWIKE